MKALVEESEGGTLEPKHGWQKYTDISSNVKETQTTLYYLECELREQTGAGTWCPITTEASSVLEFILLRKLQINTDKRSRCV